MTNAERIAALRHCGKNQGCDGCPLWSKPPSACSKLLPDAADALEAADEKIADCVAAIEALDDSNDAYIKENERLKKRIAKLEKSYEWKAYAALEESIEGYKTRIAELEAQMPKEGEWQWDEAKCMYRCSVCKSPKAREDGLKQPWNGNAWCNPPYGRDIAKWLDKAEREIKTNANIIVLLVHARTDTKWFHRYLNQKPNVELRFVKGRLKFGGADYNATFPSMIAIMRKDGNDV